MSDAPFAVSSDFSSQGAASLFAEDDPTASGEFSIGPVLGGIIAVGTAGVVSAGSVAAAYEDAKGLPEQLSQNIVDAAKVADAAFTETKKNLNDAAGALDKLLTMSTGTKVAVGLGGAGLLMLILVVALK